MKRSLSILSVISMLLVTIFLSAQAQSESYVITWFTIGAGGTSTNGVYQLAGTASQSEAGMRTMSGGEFVLDGGFWNAEIQQKQIYLPIVTR